MKLVKRRRLPRHLLLFPLSWTRSLFTKTIREAAANVHKRLRQVEYRTQAADHPILWTGGEQASYYLKFYIFQVVDEEVFCPL